MFTIRVARIPLLFAALLSPLFLLGCPPGIPAITTFLINNAAVSTTLQTVILNSNCMGVPTQYMASESPAFAGASWQTYTTTASFMLSSGIGVKTVYFKVSNGTAESAVASDTISLSQNALGSNEQTILLPGNVPLVMMWMPPGEFMMGQNPGEQDGGADEGPQHRVKMQSFWMAKYELTNRQWVAVMGTSPLPNSPPPLSYLDRPAVLMSWNGAQAFIAALNNYTGLTFRLPSEAEWEYACRASTTTRFYWGDDPGYTAINDYAWYYANSSSQLHDVGGKLPNAWGLYDMSGNAWEWCEDDWHTSYAGAPADGTAWVDSPRAPNRLERGGSRATFGNNCRSADRFNVGSPLNVSNTLGLRLAR